LKPLVLLTRSPLVVLKIRFLTKFSSCAYTSDGTLVGVHIDFFVVSRGITI
jgi:hypothetical protein